MDDLQVSGVSDLERLYQESGDRLWWALFAYAGDREIASDAAAEAFRQGAGDARDSRSGGVGVAGCVPRRDGRATGPAATRTPSGDEP